MLNYRELGSQILILRRRRGLSQEQLAEMVDVSASFIGHVEPGTGKVSLECARQRAESRAYLCGIQNALRQGLIDGFPEGKHLIVGG